MELGGMNDDLASSSPQAKKIWSCVDPNYFKASRHTSSEVMVLEL